MADEIITNELLINGPYINTVLTGDISVTPMQMDNSIFKHIKDNIIEKYERKCYRNYGFIVKIHQIIEHTDGTIVQEDPMASARFGVKFACRICNPIKKKQIICKIEKINNVMINATNGPITVIITMNRINKKIFFQDQRNNKLMMMLNNKSSEVVPGIYVKIIIESKTFNDRDTIIMAIGELYGIATEEEVKKSFGDEYGTNEEDLKLVDFDNYIQGETKNKEKFPTDQKDKEAPPSISQPQQGGTKTHKSTNKNTIVL